MNWKKGCILGLATALSLGIGAGVKAATLGCAANDITMWTEQAFIDDASQYYDPSETWQIIIGDPIIIGVGSKGTKALWMCQPDGIYAQYYDTSSWGTNFWLNGTDTAKHYQSPYYIDWYENPGVDITSLSHSKSTSGDTTTVTTVMDLGSDAQVKQVITYKTGAYSYNMRWEVKNTSGATLNDVRLFHGGDTYFGDDDDARSWYDAGRKMVYVNNPNFNVTGIMGFYGNELTPADHYFGGSYSTGGDYASETARLPDTADSTYRDAGYQLEWDRATLANNATFVVEATEIVTDPTAIAVIAPSNQSTGKSVTTTLDFVVHNLDETGEINARVSPTATHVLNLQAQSSQGWEVAIVGPAQVSLDWQERATVPVRVTVPSGASMGAVDTITLTATDSTNSAMFGVGSSRLTVTSTDYEISSTNLNFTGNTRRRVITIRNNAPVGREGVAPQVIVSDALLLGQVGGSNPLESPFSIGDDSCSNQEIPAGDSCTIEVLYAPEGEGPFEDSFNIPVLAPVSQNWTVDVTGTGGTSMKLYNEKINYGCFIDSLTR